MSAEYAQNRESHAASLDHGRNTYEVGGSHIEVSWKRFRPERAVTREGVKNPIVAVLPGWGMDEKAKTIGDLTKEYADATGIDGLAISTRSTKVLPHSLEHEAEGIRLLFEEMGIDEATVAGFSQGGPKASNLVERLEEMNSPDSYSRDEAQPAIAVRGLILLDPMSVYQQGEAGLAANFVWDSVGTTPLDIVPKSIDLKERKMNDPSALKTLVLSGTDIVAGTAKKIARSALKPQKLITQLQEMAQLNPNLKKIHAPIILVQGGQDPISNQEKLISDTRKMSWGMVTLTDSGKYINVREDALRDVFPNSSYVRALLPEKKAHHSLPLYRSKQVAKATTYLLDRFWENAPLSAPEKAINQEQTTT